MLQCQQRGSHNQGGGSVDCPKQRLYVRARHERSRHPAQGAKRKPDCAQRVDRVLEREHRRPLRPHSITSSAWARKGRQIGRERRQLLVVTVCPPKLDTHVTPLDVSRLGETIAKGVDAAGETLRRFRAKISNDRQSRPLRIRRQGASGHAAQSSQKLPSPHEHLPRERTGSGDQ